MIKSFRTVSIFEGLSYLAILSVTLGFISREWVSILGMAHGVLFLLYLVLSLMVSGNKKWSVLGWLMLFVASVIPFAFIFVELYFQKTEQGDPQKLDAAV